MCTQFLLKAWLSMLWYIFFLVLGVLRHCSGILKANTEFNKQIIAVNSGPSRWSSRHLQTVSFHVTRSYLLTHQIWRNQVEKKTHLSILSGINVIHLPRSAKDGCQIDQFWQGGESFFFDVVPTWLGGVNFSAYCYFWYGMMTYDRILSWFYDG